MKPNARAVAVAVVCVVAIGLAAATLPNPDTLAGSGAGVGGGSGGGIGNGSATGAGDAGGPPVVGSFSGSMQSLAVCYPVLTTPGFLLGALAVVALVLFVVARRTDALVAGVLLLVFSVPSVLLYSFLTACTFEPSSKQEPAQAPPPGINLTGGGGGGGGGADAAVQATLSTPVLVALALVVVGAVVFVLRNATGDDTEPEALADAPESENDLHAVGRAAGDAADRIESGTNVDNEVYRAWRELTDRLDVDDPATTTAAEFADAARDAGMRSEDVTALTDVFREVRYGGANPEADDREARAVDALRAIEAEYAEASRDADSPRDAENEVDS
ncbi:DUF4129 domain-containing protein [Halocalculus aciditolerans]|uniref:Protein-glutamine gamma-glutamyltransferase-like C-terminal domain-containing protein n=1 Tax=Halocalculus aciditolerans TaxID=1383812 RepID=A0A830FD37_9EURY|nr:DUF4129 domain-containing protein [Halocalculus aciditolerans]GGL63525.1 hypothetical protein GCM10009039_21810 [Halocalculus aciditolerans]